MQHAHTAFAEKSSQCHSQHLIPPLDSVRRAHPADGNSAGVAGGGLFSSMSKRFTQTEKWLDPGLRDLPPQYRFLWIYLCDFCDMAGVWKKDLKAASFFIGGELSEEKALELFNEEKERVVVFNNSKYWVLKDFCNFQYGAFNPQSPIHARVFGVLKGFGVDTLWGRVGATLGTRVEEEEEEEKEKGKEIIRGKPTLSQVRDYFLGLNQSLEAEKFFDYFQSNGWRVGGRAAMKDWRAAARNWVRRVIKSEPAQKPQKPDDYTAKVEGWKKEAAPMPNESREILGKFGIKSNL